MENVAQLSFRLISELGNKLTRSQLVILQYLIMYGDCDLSQKELADALEINVRSVIVALRGLENLGVVERVKAKNKSAKGLIRLKELENVE